MSGRHVVRNAPGLAAAVLAACAATGAAEPGNFDTMTRDARAIVANLKENVSRDKTPIRAVTVPGAVRAEWVTPERKLNALPAGAMLLSKRDIPFPSGYPRVVFYHGKILTSEEAIKGTKEAKEYATVGLMREHLRGIFNFAW